MNQTKVIGAIMRERERQNAKFGVTNPLTDPEADPFLKMACLTEEVGEAAHAIIELSRQDTDVPHVEATIYDVIAELVQVAAVAVAMLESIPDPDA